MAIEMNFRKSTPAYAPTSAMSNTNASSMPPPCIMLVSGIQIPTASAQSHARLGETNPKAPAAITINPAVTPASSQFGRESTQWIPTPRAMAADRIIQNPKCRTMPLIRRDHAPDRTFFETVMGRKLGDRIRSEWLLCVLRSIRHKVHTLLISRISKGLARPRPY